MEWSLRADPMHPGDERILQALVPLMNAVARVEMRAVGL